MAREKAKNVTTIGSWNEADGALREIGELTRKIAKREAEATERIENIRAKLQMETAEAVARKTSLVHDVEAFATMHKAEMIQETGGKKSLELAHGRMGFRKSTRIVLRKVEKIIAAIREKGWLEFLREKTEIDKEALHKLEDEHLAEIGVRREVEDVFWCEPNEVEAKSRPA